MNTPEKLAHTFYTSLREEVVQGNSYLNGDEQLMLQKHYPVIINPRRYPAQLAATVYSSRRSHAVQAILETENPVVFDAGCGYGSESFLFASIGARVLSVDRSAKQIAIAVKRKRYFEEIFGKAMDITFAIADLNRYIPEVRDLSLTWLASVLAAIDNQDAFLKRVHEATREGGKVIITDMNLLNPLFLWNEWRRRRRALNKSPEFAHDADFWKMLWRKGRVGARYFPLDDEGVFDDVQFFTPDTLSRLIKRIGFSRVSPSFSGFVPPIFLNRGLSVIERTISKIPVIRVFSYFYIVTGMK